MGEIPSGPQGAVRHRDRARAAVAALSTGTANGCNTGRSAAVTATPSNRLAEQAQCTGTRGRQISALRDLYLAARHTVTSPTAQGRHAAAITRDTSPATHGLTDDTVG